MFSIASLLAASAPPARGAPLGDLVWATAVATVISAAVLWVASAHRAGRIVWLGRTAKAAERFTGLPSWAALPILVTAISQGIAVFGFYWDVSKHIDTGRDPGPFGTAAHYPILIGLAGITLGGFLAIVLGTNEPGVGPNGSPSRAGAAGSPGSVRLARNWYAPLGGLLIFLCGSFALIGFPLDDIWHTLFGQDVTLWGPTHVLMIAGASLSTLGAWVLLTEGARARSRPRSAGHGQAAPAQPSGLPASQARMLRWREIGSGAAFLIALSTLQGEFDYGVPQFQLVFQPILIALATAAGLVAARVRLGRGGALGASLFYLAVYGLLCFTIRDVIGGSTLHFPLYLPEALLVELAAWRMERASRAPSPVALGVVSGVLIGTLGLAAEWGWSHVWMPLPWATSMLPEAAILGLLAALAGGVLGGFVGGALDRGRRGGTRAAATDTPVAASTAPAWLAGLAGAVAIACIAYPLPMNAGSPMSATARLTTVNATAHRTAMASFRISPATAANDAQWVTATAWQGGGLVVDRLRRTEPGVYVTTQPIPVYGKWKTMLRIANGRALDAVPIYLPDDPAIPAPAVAAPASFTRTFTPDRKILQREAIGGEEWLKIPAYLLLLAIAALWIAALTWGLRRLSLGEEVRVPGERPVKPRAGAVAGITG